MYIFIESRNNNNCYVILDLWVIQIIKTLKNSYTYDRREEIIVKMICIYIYIYHNYYLLFMRSIVAKVRESPYISQLAAVVYYQKY